MAGERELTDILKELQKLNHLVERFLPLVDEVEKELRLMRDYLEKHDKREEMRLNEKIEDKRPY